jgi:hypothetical protein
LVSNAAATASGNVSACSGALQIKLERLTPIRSVNLVARIAKFLWKAGPL